MNVAGWLDRARNQLSVVTRLGWGFVATGLATWVLGSALGWAELRLAALALVVLVAASVLFTLGGMTLQLDLRLDPIRVRPGGTSSGRLAAGNDGPRAIRAARVELPVGATVASYVVPALKPGDRHTTGFDIPTTRRGVITVGPVTSVRGDPFGLVRREVSWAAPLELFVHPRIVPLPSLDAGLVRDLEGRATTDPSVSDLDFHTLRPYVAGDDRRHIHWRSSARATAARGTTAFLVKGYTDTRRSHLGIVVDGRMSSYVDEDAFEVGLVAAASVTVRALRDEMDVTVVAVDHAMDRLGVARTLDGFARAQPSPTELSDLTARLVTLAPATSIVLLVTGAEHPFTDLRRATAQFAPHVRVLALRVSPGRPTGTTPLPDLTVLTMGELSDLPRLVTIGGLA